MKLITILGPTASGKTAVATQLAYKISGEIISADSRQIYRKMDLGTGKDLNEYTVNGISIPYHLIDIVDAGYKYNVYEYQHDFNKAYTEITNRGANAILCGGTGMYIEAVLRGYKLVDVPENCEIRNSLANKSLSELEAILSTYKKLHNKTDIDTVKRAIRAIEIAEYYKTHHINENDYAPIESVIIGLDIDRELRREKITKRLKQRLNEGMINEVKELLDSGISPEDLIYYGLEYKFLTLYCTGQITYDEMFSQLEIAIHQFAKRQMTWFRGMERRGFSINWIDASKPMEEKMELILDLI